MAFVETSSGTLYYRLEGTDGKPVVVFSHSLGLDHGMWAVQVEALAPHFQVLRFDTRGHGASAVVPGDYTIGALGRDVLELADALDIRQFAFCGLSLGGMIGQWLAVHAGDRITHLVLANTSPRLSDPAIMEARRRAVLEGGMAVVEEAVMARFFSPASIARNPPPVAEARRTLRATSPAGYAGCCAAIRDMDQSGDLARIAAATLVIAGERDVSLPWAGHGERLAAAIPGAAAVRLDAAHLSNLERPRTFTAALLRFLLPRPADTLTAGTSVRRSVLGDAHVDRAIASTTDLNGDFQELVTRFAWGTIWTRPGLDRRTRRLLVLVITASMGRWEEFRLHLRAGLDDDLEWADVEEALLQTGVYAGVPAANTAFAVALEERRQRTDAG